MESLIVFVMILMCIAVCGYIKNILIIAKVARNDPDYQTNALVLVFRALGCFIPILGAFMGLFVK